MNPLFRCALFAFALLGIVPAFAAEPVFPPGSRIGLVPPAGMAASDRFQGFEDRARGAMLVVTELTAQTYAEVAKEFAPEAMQAGGMDTLSREDVALPFGQGHIVVARQTVGGVPMRKWALLALADDITAVIIASMPEAAGDAYPDAALRAALSSVTVRAKLPLEEMLEVLPYRLADLGGFRLMRAAQDGTAVLTLGPNDTSLPVEQPYFMVAPRAGEVPPAAEHGRFAQRVLLAFANRPGMTIVSSEPMRIGGEAGHQIIAETKDERTGDPLRLVQWLRFTPGGYVQMFGIARQDQWGEAFPRMRAVRDGFGGK